MRFTILYNVFARDFKRQKKRMLLTLMAILWGTMSIMLLLAFGEGMKQQFAINTKGLGDGIVIVWGGQTSIPYMGFGKGRKIWLHPDDVGYLKSRMPELEAVAAEYIRWGAPVKYGKMVLNERINGLYPEYRELRNFRPALGGRMINRLDMELGRRVAFLGNRVKDRLFGAGTPNEAVVGKNIYIYSTPYTVVGVMEPKLQMSSYQGRDEDVIAIPATTFHTLLGDPYLDNIIYKPKDLSNAAAVEQRVLEVMGAKNRFDPADERALPTWDIIEQAKTTNDMFLGVQIFFGFVGALTLMIAAVGVANIMYVSIRERTREIGIKMAVGARKMYILVQFLMEALGITFFGGLLGMSIAYILTEFFKLIPVQSEVLDIMGKPTVSWEIGVTVTVILGIMGFFSGLFPALRAASIDPNDALRYE